MIGIIFSPAQITKIAKGEPYSADVLFYLDMAQRNKIDICFYSIKRISLQEQKVMAYVYPHEHGQLTRKNISIPLVNLYRGDGYLRKESAIHKVKELGRRADIIFLNAVTNKERCKYTIYKYLQANKKISPYLPDTDKLHFHSLQRFLEKYKTVFVKPRRGSKGNHIYMLRDNGGNYQVFHALNQTHTIAFVPKDQLHEHYQKWFASPSKFIVQQGIPLKEFQGKKFDIRVSPQKNKHNRWQVTGMIARIAVTGGFVTNLDQGGQAKTNVQKLLRSGTKKEIRRLSLRIARMIERRYPQAVDLGLDFAVDQNDKLWFLEVNFRPLRRKVWIKRHRIPFEHACTLYQQKVHASP